MSLTAPVVRAFGSLLAAGALATFFVSLAEAKQAVMEE